MICEKENLKNDVQNNSIDLLLVEDNPINQKLFAYYFKEYLVSYDVVSDGFEAIEKLRKQKYKLILLDIELPIKDGYNTAQEIREVLNIDTPIVAITSHEIDEVKDQCFETGMDACFSKPISKLELVAVLSQFLPQEIFTQAASKQQKINKVPEYRTIDFDYLKQISMGDKVFEKRLTEQFCEKISENLNKLDECLVNENVAELKFVAHQMHSTIFIMGMRSKLGAHLDAIERKALNFEQLKARVGIISLVCKRARDEAREFLASAG
ncbi:hypothetical protein DHW03_17785 [Pedobacter yonginense]|uniref:Response regulatory domain-containing protein n=1 Tax=Pedobacter yonginense TaxID=651869 RepID=A0A317EJU8_9SPHI|nr:response regulator [Pedobacter yonginense]PWS26615.1 hypothetical protein DHW03_17785 [Pedobacter yonginense]